MATQTRISKHVKAIADAHIAARLSGNFDNPKVNTKEDVFAALNSGKTFEGVLNEIEVRFVSVTSTLLARMMEYKTEAYKKQVYKGFKVLLQS